MARIFRSESAKRDATAIWVSIAERNIKAADDLTADFEAALRTIAMFPGAGTSREELGTGLRSYPVGNYLLIFRRARRGVELVRIVHGARDLRRIFKQRRRR